ncbi:MAG: cysteine synthase [Gammaproteobacteria bacterium RIFCSPHIGHO2_12_FULL_38_11]|nr:MAG: cysteine synthase [Gammaproteobacteria bacterium RIFCSPHIGHO2_12_FULL_38_11]
MHILMIESNPAGISGIKAAIQEGYQVTFVTADPQFYVDHNADAQAVFNHPSCRVIHNTEIFHTETLLKLADEINALTKIDGVVTYSEYHVVRAAEVAAHLKLPGMNVEGAKNARFKHRTRETLVNTHIVQPAFIHVKNEKELSEAVNKIGFPCVVKTSDGTASMNVTFIKGQEELTAYLHELQKINNYGRAVTRSHDLLVEEFISGELVSVEACVFGKDNVVNLGVTDRILSGFPNFIEMGCTYLNDHPVKNELFKVNSDVLKLLNIDFGFIHTEYFLTERGPVLCEVNGRLIGGLGPKLMEISSGINPFLEVIHLAVQTEVQLPFPSNKIACARWFGAPLAGKIREMNFGDINTFQGFEESCSYKKIGEHVSRLSKSNFDWLGHVVFSGDSYKTAVDRAEAAMNSLSIDLTTEIAR